MAAPTRYQVSVTFTDECNMRCVYCTTAKRKVFITPALVDRVLLLLDRTAPASLDLNFHGGEPTLVWDQVQRLNAGLITIGADRRISRNLCTNGTHLDATRAAFLKENGFDVRVSIDGRKSSHTRFRFGRDRKNPETSADLYDRTLAGLRALIAADVSTAANMVVTAETVGSLLSNAVFLIRQGLIHLVISPVVGMPWPDEALLMFDAQLRGMTPIWQKWMARVSPRRHEDLRRSILSEIDRAAYCIGERMNQPGARVLVIGPDGRIFGDEPDVRTDKALVIGHVNEIEDFTELPALPRTAFQLMYDREFYAPHVLRDVRRTHRLLRKRLSEMYAVLFPHQAMVIDRSAG
ncbi:MAG: sulfatase maturation enzyme AslB (radical SAM superfamily) [Myxococcota bacterium]|jgi:sulfatase maturation enzyme AslB (radical SAM superfamily)